MKLYLLNLYNSDKKLTAFLICISFLLTNIIKIKISENDPYLISLEVEISNVIAANAGLPKAYVPYKGKAKVLDRSYIENSNPSYEDVEFKLAGVESKIDYDYINNSSSKHIRTGGLTKNISTASRHISRTPVASPNAGFTNKSSPSTSLSGGYTGKAYSNTNKGQNNTLKAYNNYREDYWQAQSRGNENAVNVSSEEEDASTKKIQDEITSAQADAELKAKNYTDKSNAALNNSNSGYMASLGLFIGGIASILLGYKLISSSNSATVAAGWALIAAGLAMIGMAIAKFISAQKQGAGAGNTAGDYSNMAGLEYDNLAHDDDVQKYVNNRIELRDASIRDYSVSSSVSSVPHGYSRGDNRNKASFYGRVHSASIEGEGGNSNQRGRTQTLRPGAARRSSY